MKKEYIMSEMNDELKEGEDILFSSGNMVGSGTVFKIMDGEDIIVQTGNGGRGLEYIKKSDIIRA
jgi:preprotein translocase subunit YajC|tara:strand:- start:209 stop:403 length:195 start_codon:yes stop_codon:yes gene_type:complete